MPGRFITGVVALLLALPGSSRGQAIRTNLYVTNGPVYATALSSTEDTLYIGGSFSTVGLAAGGCAWIDAVSGEFLGPKDRVTGTVYAAAPDGEGGWFLGGSFGVGNPVEMRRNLAHIGADGALSPTFQAVSVNDTVRALAVSGSTVYVGGDFASINGQARNHIAALDAVWGSVTSWNPNANNDVRTLAVAGSVVYAGGDFTSVGGQTRNRITALDATTGLAASTWNPNANGPVNCVVVSGSSVYVGGAFTNIGGSSRNRIAALSVTTGSAASWNPNASASVRSIVVDGSRVYAGGGFTTIGGQTRNRIAALSATTGLALSWNPNSNALVECMAVSGSTVYAGGSFTSIGGQSRNRLVALDAATGSATAWNPNTNAPVYTIAVSGATVCAGGEHSTLDLQTRNNIAALDATTGRPLAWNPDASSGGGAADVYALAVSGATVYAGGQFTSIGGATRNRIGAIDATTGSAASWNPNASAAVRCIVVDGLSVYAGGLFTSIGGATRNRIAALNASGLARSWNPNANASVECMAISGSTVYAGGNFTSIGGQTRNRIAALSATTGLAISSWNPNAGGQVLSIAVSGSTVYAGGVFTSIGGQTRNRIAALDATGLATGWNPNADGPVYTLAMKNSTVYAGGAFAIIGGTIRHFIACIDAMTGLAKTWDARLIASLVQSLAVSEATVYAGGTELACPSTLVSTTGIVGISVLFGPPELSYITIPAAPNVGLVSPDVFGANIDPRDLTATLSGPDSLDGTSVTRISDTQVQATFDLAGVPLGTYKLTIRNALGADSLSRAIVVHDAAEALIRSTVSLAWDQCPILAPITLPGDPVVFVSQREGVLDLYVKDAEALDIGGAIKLTSGEYVSRPSWSPDAQKIVYEKTTSGQIRIVDADSGLVLGPSTVTTGKAPEWSKATNRIAFGDGVSGGREAIFVVNPNGTGRVQVTDPPSGSSDRWPTWSPDGARIAFVRDTGAAGALLSVSASGGVAKVIVPAEGFPKRHARWSPDGRWIAYAANPSGNYNLFVVDSRGKGLGFLQLTTDPGNDEFPAWDAQGGWLAFDSDRSGDADVYIRQNLPTEFDEDGDGVIDVLDACNGSPPRNGELDRNFNGCADSTSSFRQTRFWSADQLPVMFETDAVGDPRIADDSEFPELAEGLRIWTTPADVSLSGGDDGLRGGPSIAVGGDGRNSVTFQDPDGYLPLTLAITVSTVATADTVIRGRWYRPGEIIDADILFNAADYRFSTPTYTPGTRAYDVRSVATHEFGHVLGLTHSSISTATMFYVVPPNTTPWTLEEDDQALLRRGYASLSPTLTIEGRVVRNDGINVVVGAGVYAIAASDGDTLQMTVSGVDGRYRFFGLSESFRVWVHPLDGSVEVNGVTAGVLGPDLAEVSEVNFLPEFWDEAAENNDDWGAPGFVVPRPGPPVMDAEIVLNGDQVLPTVSSTIPPNGDLNATAAGAVTVRFRERIDAEYFRTHVGISLRRTTPPTSGVGGTAAFVQGDSLLVFTPSPPLDYGIDYRLRIGPDIRDIAGNAMADSMVVNFRTEAQPAVQVVSISPPSVTPGGFIVLQGIGFSPQVSDNQIHFPGGGSVTPSAATPDRLYAVVPEGVISGDLTVQTGSNTSNALPLTVVAPRSPPRGDLEGSLVLGGEPRRIAIRVDGAYAYVATSMGVQIVDAAPTSPGFLSSVTLPVPEGVSGVVALPDGKRTIAVGPVSPRLHVIDTQGPLPHEVLRETDLTDEPLGIALVPGGVEVLVAFANRLVLVATPPAVGSAQFGQELREWPVAGDTTSLAGSSFTGDVVVSPDGSTVVAATGEGRYLLFDFDSGNLVGSATGSPQPQDLASVPDASKFLGVGLSGQVEAFSPLGVPRSGLTIPGGLSALAVSPEGTFAYATNLLFNRVEILDLQGVAPAQAGNIPTGMDPVDVETGGAGRYLLVISAGSDLLQVFDTVAGPVVESVFPRSGGPGTLVTIAGSGFSPVAGNNVVAIGNQVVPVETASPSGRALVARQTPAVTAGPLSVTVAGKASNPQRYCVVDRTTPGSFVRSTAVGVGPPAVAEVSLSPTGALVLAVHADGRLSALGADPRRDDFHQVIQSLDPLASGLTAPGEMAMSPDGMKLYVADRAASRIRVFGVTETSATPLIASGVVRDGSGPAAIDAAGLAVSPDGRRLLAADSKNSAIFDIETERDSVLSVVTGNFSTPAAVTAHPEGRVYALVTCQPMGGWGVFVFDIDDWSVDTTIAFADAGSLVSGQTLALGGDGKRVHALVKTAGGTFLLKTIDVDPGSPTFASVLNSTAVGSGPSVPSLALNHSGALLYVMDPNAGAQSALDLGSFVVHAGPTGASYLGALGLAVSADDARLYAGGPGTALRVTDLTPVAGLVAERGWDQVGVESEALPRPFTVQLTAAGPTTQVEGTPITFSSLSGGSFAGRNPRPVAADSRGEAQVQYVPGTGAGVDTIRVFAGADSLELRIPVVQDTSLVGPAVLALRPANAETVGVYTTIAADFSKAIARSAVGPASFVVRLQAGGIPVVGTYVYAEGGRRVVFAPVIPLLDATNYEVQLTSGLKDHNGNSLTNPVSFAFRTEPAPEMVEIRSIQPPAATVGDPVVIAGSGFGRQEDAITVLFGGASEVPTGMDPGTITTRVPPGTITGPLRVQVGPDTSNAVDFELLVPAPEPVSDPSDTVEVPTSGRNIAIHRNGNWAYMTSPEGNTVVAIPLRGATGVQTVIPVGIYPFAVAISPQGDCVYVSNYFSNDISVIDAAEVHPTYHQVIATIPAGLHPSWLTVDPEGRRLYVCNQGDATLTAFDIEPGSAGFFRARQQVQTNSSAQSVVVTPDGGRILVATGFGLLILDADDMTARQQVQTSSSGQSVVVTPDGGFCILLTQDGGLHLVDINPGSPFEGHVRGWARASEAAQAMGMSADGGYLYVSNWMGAIESFCMYRPGENGASAERSVSPFSFVKVGEMEVGENPVGLALTPDGRELLVVNAGDRTVTVLGSLRPIECAGESQLYGGTQTASSAPDTVAFSLPWGATQVLARLTWAGSPGVDLDLRLWRSNGTLVRAGATAAEPESVLIKGVPSGDYVLQVSGATVPIPTDWTLNVKTCQPTQTAVPEGVLAGATLDVQHGAPQLRWDVLPEARVVGFHVYRATDPAKGYTRLTRDLLRSSGAYTYLDTGAGDLPGETVFYELGALRASGQEDRLGPWQIDLASVRPLTYRVFQNQPNPFLAREGTRIRFTMPDAGDVSLEVFDLRGALVRGLARRRFDPGRHEIAWDGRNGLGQSVATGMYFYRFEAKGRYVETKRMLLLK